MTDDQVVISSCGSVGIAVASNTRGPGSNLDIGE